jgi:hypothetical protein
MRQLRTVFILSILGLSVAAAGCGDDDDDGGDADAAVGPDAADSPDADVGAACPEFETPAGTISSVPGSFDGDVVGAGADLQVAEGVCTVESSFFTQEGVDQVVAVTGLTAGTDYVARIRAAADLSMYVATECDTTTGGPAAGECLLFADAALGREFGAFTAPADGQAFVVVDNFFPDPPADGSYTLDIYEAECAESAECTGGAAPHCFEAHCVGCVTPFDCETAGAPACSTDNACVAGFDSCTGDDARESGDDGPAGATVLAAPTAGTPTTIAGAICSVPAEEADYFTFTVAEGDDRVVAVDWTGAEDVDVYVFDDTGAAIGFSFFEQPEFVRLDDMTAGTYYVAVQQFDGGDAAAVAYTLSLSIPECTSHFDCTTSGAPQCNPLGTCVAGPGDCTGDDGRENADDGPAGATDVTPAIDAMTTIADGKICNSPGSEADFFAVTVADGDDIDIQVSWTDAVADLDVATFLADGTVTGITFWRSPETIALTNLPAGTHYIQVTYFGTETATAVDYTLTVARSAGGCTTVADCASEYETQLFRGSCTGGACEFIDGAGAVADGALCDTPDDCVSGRCSYVSFESDADASVCTVTCASDADCTTALGAGYQCTTPFSENFCHPTCTVDTDCGANTGSEAIDTGLPWDYLTCNGGACDL